MTGRIKEQAHVLGARQSMVGILSPANPAPPEEVPCVVELNAGIIHRVGPNRLSVTLARALCGSGFNVLRFDFSGIGDSDPREEVLAPVEAAMTDLREVLDWLQRTRNARRFILVGLCSGADQSVLYCSRDDRVIGIVLLDPTIPHTRGFYRRHLINRIFNGRTWLSVLSGRHELWDKLLRRKAAPSPEPSDSRGSELDSPAARAFLENAYRNAVNSGVKILAVFSGAGGREYWLNYPEQILDAFPGVNFGSAIQIEYLKRADHTLSFESDRNHVIGVIGNWIQRVAGISNPTSARTGQ